MNFQLPFIKNFKTLKWQPTNLKYLYWQYIKNVVIEKKNCNWSSRYFKAFKQLKYIF